MLEQKIAKVAKEEEKMEPWRGEGTLIWDFGSGI